MCCFVPSLGFLGFRTKEVKPKFIDVPLSGLQVEFEFGVRKNWWKNGGILKLRNLSGQTLATSAEVTR